MTKVPTTQRPSTTKPFLSHTSRSKTKLASPPHYINLFGESVCESAEENPLHLDEFNFTFSIFFNPYELPKPTKTSIPNQPCGGFCSRTKKITIEDPKKLKVVNPNPHSTICNPEPIPSFVLDTLSSIPASSLS